MKSSKPPANPTGAAAAPRPGQLVDVSNKLAEMISSLQRSREALQSRVSGPAPAPTAAPAGRPGGGIAAEASAELRGREDEEGLRERLEELEAANRAVGDELVWLQAQIAHAVGLSVTLRRLHESGSRAEVLDALGEAIVNILGCEQFAVLLAEGEQLRVARTMGLAEGRGERLTADLVAHVSAGKRLAGAEARAIDLALTAFVPLAARGQIVGAFLLEALLPQRGALGPLDAEVMELLGHHGALAYLAAPERAS